LAVYAAVAAEKVYMFALPLICHILVIGSSPRLAVSLIHQTIRPLSQAQIFEKYQGSIGKVVGTKKFGTGFIVSVPGNAVMTCFHVIENESDIRFELPGRKAVRLERVIAADKERDFAVLSSSQLIGKAVPLDAADTVKIGEPLTVIGTPLGRSHTLTSGVLSNKETTSERALHLNPHSHHKPARCTKILTAIENRGQRYTTRWPLMRMPDTTDQPVRLIIHLAHPITV
jgi:hypothetical protein